MFSPREYSELTTFGLLPLPLMYVTATYHAGEIFMWNPSTSSGKASTPSGFPSSKSVSALLRKDSQVLSTRHTWHP